MEVRELVKVVPGFQLGPLTHAFRAGSLCGVVGGNGMGKSTLLGCLTGHSSWTSGSITLAGEPVTPRDIRLRAAAALLPEAAGLYPGMTALDHLRLTAPLWPLWDHALAARLFDRLRIPGGVKSEKLSGGTKRKLTLVLAVAAGARWLCLDEPTAGLDPDARFEVAALVRELVGLGRGVVLSSHIFDDVEDADEILFMKDGSVVLRTERHLPKPQVLTVRSKPGMSDSRILGRLKRGEAWELLVSPSDVDSLAGTLDTSERRTASLRDIYQLVSGRGL